MSIIFAVVLIIAGCMYCGFEVCLATHFRFLISKTKPEDCEQFINYLKEQPPRFFFKMQLYHYETYMEDEKKKTKRVNSVLA